MIYTLRRQLARWLFFAPFTIASAIAGETASLVCSSVDGSSAGLARLADEMLTDDHFYRKLVAWKGVPSACKGSAASGQDGESWLDISWPDQSTFRKALMPPEILVVRYSSARGLDRQEEVIAALREYASRHGLRIDWSAAHPSDEDGTRLCEYRDKDSGINGIVRIVYDRRQRLIAVSMSIAP